MALSACTPKNQPEIKASETDSLQTEISFLTGGRGSRPPLQNPDIKHKNLNSKAGITLIALIITIVVMLILVAVTISVALNGGLIDKAQEAKTKTEEAKIQEKDLLTGRIKIGGKWYDSLDEYLENNPSDDQNDESSKWGEGENVGKLATEVLKVDSNATEVEKKGPYVRYNNLLWKAIYDSDSSFGLQLISVEPIENMTFGSQDPTVNANDLNYDGNEIVDEGALHAIASQNHGPERVREALDSKLSKGPDDVMAAIRPFCSSPDFSEWSNFSKLTAPADMPENFKWFDRSFDR